MDLSASAGTVIAEGQDKTHQHPLGHAIMVAIEAAAARDRQLWPIKSKDIASDSKVLIPDIATVIEKAAMQANKDVTLEKSTIASMAACHDSEVKFSDSIPNRDGVVSNEAQASSAVTSLSGGVSHGQPDAHSDLVQAEDRAGEPSAYVLQSEACLASKPCKHIRSIICPA